MTVTGTEQRVYGTLTGGCIIDLHRFALVSGSTTDSPTTAVTVTYANTTPYKQCGYKYNGYLTLFLSISGSSIYAAVELRICKNDAKRIVIETYGEVAKTVTGGMSLWFNKGSDKHFPTRDDFPETGSDNVNYIDDATGKYYIWNESSYEEGSCWVKLNSTTSGVIMPYATTSYTFKESKRNGSTTIDCCKKCPSCGCKTCNVASRFSAKSINALLFDSTCCDRIETSEIANFPDPSQLVGREIYIWYNHLSLSGSWMAPQLYYKTTIVGVDESGIIMDEAGFIDYLAPPESDQTSAANQSAINRTYTTTKSMTQTVSYPGPSWYYNKCGYGGLTFGRYTGRNRVSFTIDEFTITGADGANYLDGTHVALVSMYFKTHPETTYPIPNGDPQAYIGGTKLFRAVTSAEFNAISGMTFDNILMGNSETLSAPYGLYFAVYFNDGAHGAATINFSGTIHEIIKCNGESASLSEPFVCIPYDFESSPVMGETAFLWACFTPSWSLGGVNTLTGTALPYPIDPAHSGEQSISYNNGAMVIQYKLNCNTIDIYSFVIAGAAYYMTYYVDDLGVSNLLSSGFEFDDSASFPFDYLKNCVTLSGKIGINVFTCDTSIKLNNCDIVGRNVSYVCYYWGTNYTGTATIVAHEKLIPPLLSEERDVFWLDDITFPLPHTYTTNPWYFSPDYINYTHTGIVDSSTWLPDYIDGPHVEIGSVQHLFQIKMLANQLGIFIGQCIEFDYEVICAKSGTFNITIRYNYSLSFEFETLVNVHNSGTTSGHIRTSDYGFTPAYMWKYTAESRQLYLNILYTYDIQYATPSEVMNPITVRIFNVKYTNQLGEDIGTTGIGIPFNGMIESVTTLTLID